MEIETEQKFSYYSRINSFGQIVTSGDNLTYTTVTGTIEELLEYSKTHSVYVQRNAVTEFLFESKSWDSAKFAELFNAKVLSYADRLCEINGHGWYVHKGVIVQD